MGYQEEKQRIIGYVTNNGRIITLKPDKSNLKQYCRELETFSDGKKIIIKYPGYKTTESKCDYCVFLVEEDKAHPVSHVEIMQDLYDKTTLQNYKLMKQYIEAAARDGKDIPIPDSLQNSCRGVFSFEELTALMFYIAIQEDINYPEKHYQGRKMCFCRYLEAVYCKVYTNHKLGEALDRAVARYIPKNWNDAGDLYDVVSRIQR